MLLKLFFNMFRARGSYSGILILVLGTATGSALGQEGWWWNPQPEIAARSAVLMNPATGEILFAKEPHLRLPPASTTKVLTALVVLERLDPNARVVVSPQAASAPPSRIGLRAGEAVVTQDLLYGLMLKSGNDAAETLAEAAGGSVYGFSGLMNAKAWQIGARNSHFMNPHGLPNDDHYATAYDLALIFRQAMNHPMFADIVRTRSATLRIESGSGVYGDWRMVPVQNHNRLLASYEGTRGGKTGFTLKARRCFVGEVDRGGVRLIVSILGSPNSSALWSDARTLLDYGFARYGLAPPPPVQPEPQLILVRRAPVAAPGEEEDETMVRSAPVLASSATTIRPAVRVAATPPARDWQQEAEADELMLPTKPVVAARTRGIVTTPAAARPVVAAAKPAAAARPALSAVKPAVAARPALAAVKPAVAGKPAVAAAKPAVARPTPAAAKPAVAAAKPTVMARPVAAAKPGVATAKPAVAVRPTVTAAAKPAVVKPNKPLVLAMTTVKPIGAPEKTSKLTVSASGKTMAKPASVTPLKLEKREPVKAAVRTESVAKLQKSRR